VSAWRSAAGAAVAVAAGLLLAAGPAGAADSGCYADSVDRALQVLRDARGDDRQAARRAADGLEACTGQSQREILTDLRGDPPNVADARDRLAALSRAARSPVFAPEPGRARTAVRDILGQPRYAAIRQGPSLLDRIRDTLLQVAVWVLGLIGGVVSSGFGGVLVAAAAVGLALVATVVVRSARWRGRAEARPREGGGPGASASPDRFAEADRLAATGDLDGAVRALAGAVAAALSGERAWAMSPLTVRELFARAPDPAGLRPLLVAFEAAVYGERPPDAAAYRRAAAAAAPFRPARRAAA
jgi:hypothetical protein